MERRSEIHYNYDNSLYIKKINTNLFIYHYFTLGERGMYM